IEIRPTRRIRIGAERIHQPLRHAKRTSTWPASTALTEPHAMPQPACHVNLDLSVSVVSYRTPTLLRQCLEAISAERTRLAIEVTVVDNASSDGSAEMVAEQFPWVRLIRNDRNRGFAAAHNQALRRASGRYWLVLNSDAAPSPGALRTLLDFLDVHPGAAITGPRL